MHVKLGFDALLHWAVSLQCESDCLLCCVRATPFPLRPVCRTLTRAQAQSGTHTQAHTLDLTWLYTTPVPAVFCADCEATINTIKKNHYNNVITDKV